MNPPIAYLVRVGSVDKTFPLLSDPGLSPTGIQQASEVREFFSASGIGPIKSLTTVAALQFADYVSMGITPDPELPPVIICEGEFMSIVRPGGIIMVQQDIPGVDKYVPVLGEVPLEDHN